MTARNQINLLKFRLHRLTVRGKDNAGVWDFALSGEDMAEIAKLDIGRSEIVDHSDPKFVQMLHQVKVHE